MRKFKKLNVIRETDNEVIIEKLLDEGFEEVKEEVKSTEKGNEVIIEKLLDEGFEEVKEEVKSTEKGKEE